MQLTLTPTPDHHITIACDGQHSHAFALTELFPERQDDQIVLSNPVETLFRAGTLLLVALLVLL
jgi:hypothetical protein